MKINNQFLMSTAWAAVLVYFLVSSIIVMMFGIVGVDKVFSEDPEAFGHIYLTQDVLYVIFTMQPIVIMGLLFSLMFVDVKFSRGIFKK